MVRINKHINKVLAAVAIAVAGSVCFANAPKWALKELSVNANVVEVESQSNLVKLDKGISSNYRIGAFCDMMENGELSNKTLVVIEASKDESLALLLGDFQVNKADSFKLRLINK